MTAAFHRWRGETHGSAWELVRHFVLRFFDNEMITIPGEWQKAAVGMFAALVSVALAAATIYRDRYLALHQFAGPGQYQQAIRDDLVSFIVLSMAVTALLTILQWQSLFPSLRDCLALAGLPVNPREIFAAKFGAVMLIFSAFVVSMTAMPAILFTALVTSYAPGNPNILVFLAATFAAVAGGCVFVFFMLVAIQGILLNLFKAYRFARVSTVVQAVLFVAVVGTLPLMGSQPKTAAWWPPVWFVNLWESITGGPTSLARNALLAIAIPAAISVGAYLLSYHRYQKMLLEAQSGHASARWAGLGAKLLERWIADPREQAAFAFIWKTLFRSRSHRLFLLAYAGAALGWIAKGLLDAPPVNLRDEGLYGLTVVLAPIAVAVLITVGLRYLFTLPVMLRANWVFQAVEAEGRPAWQAAIERFVIWCGIAPVVIAGLPATVAVLGPVRGVVASALGCLGALLFFERYFRQFVKLPFTCSYLPGKQPIWALMVRFGFSATMLAPIAQLFLWASSEATSFIALSSGLAALGWRWRGIRRRLWTASPILWDEHPEAAVLSMDLQRARDDDAPLSVGPVRPDVPGFGERLMASNGLLPQAWREEIDEERRSRALWETLWEDMRYGARLIRRNPLLSAVVVLTLTVGIGINASVFTVVDGTALKPLVNRDPATFLRIWPTNQRDGHERPVSYAEYIALRDRNRSLRQLAAFRPIPALIGDDDSTGTPGLAVSCNFFLVEQLDRPLLGRLLDVDDCRSAGHMPVVIISESIWRNRFHADPGIIGKTARINNHSIPVVGVVRDRTSLWVQPAGVWLPYTALSVFDPSNNLLQEDLLWLMLAGRLAPGQTRASAEAEFNTLERQLDGLTPGRRTVVETTDGSWIETFNLRAGARELFLLTFFFGAFHLVLFIACANVATLLLSRAASRRREIAVRLSLGAPRVRLVRMLVTESLLLAGLAGAASVYLLYHLPHPLFRWLAPAAPEIPLPPEWRVFAYVAVVVLLTGIASGLAPALESLKVDLAASMKGAGGKLGGALGNSRVRGWLVTAQVAMSMLLLVQAALLGKSEDSNLHADPGYKPANVVVAPLRFADAITREAAQVRLNRIAARLRSVPGVRAVTFSDDMPMIGRTTVQVRPPSRPDAVQPVDIYTAGPGFMTALGVPLARGRDFDSSDTPNHIIISESLARTFFRRRDPVGQSIVFPQGTLLVIGVARDVSSLRIGGSDNPAVWRTGMLHPSLSFLTVQFGTPALASPATVRAAMREVEPNLIVLSRNLQKWIDLITEQMWNMVSLIVILGLVATLLATSGIYGAVSFAVNQRMRDLGIRVALGASRPAIVREVFSMGGKPVVRGLVIGSWLSIAMAASLRENLKGSVLHIDSGDPLVYGSAIALLAVAAAIAMIGPARRGSNSDPLDALRCE